MRHPSTLATMLRRPQRWHRHRRRGIGQSDDRPTRWKRGGFPPGRPLGRLPAFRGVGAGHNPPASRRSDMTSATRLGDAARARLGLPAAALAQSEAGRSSPSWTSRRARWTRCWRSPSPRLPPGAARAARVQGGQPGGGPPDAGGRAREELLSSSCDDSSCIGQIGNAIGARYVGGGVGDAAAGQLTLRVRLFDMRRPRCKATRCGPTSPPPRRRWRGAPSVALAAVRPILDKEQLPDLSSARAARSVKIDGRLWGHPGPDAEAGWARTAWWWRRRAFHLLAKDVQVERNQGRRVGRAHPPRRVHRLLPLRATSATAPAPGPPPCSRWRAPGGRSACSTRWRADLRQVPAAAAAFGSSRATSPPPAARATPTPGVVQLRPQRLGRDGDQAQWIARGAGAWRSSPRASRLLFWLAGDDPGR
jgi:hypothetical protein